MKMPLTFPSHAAAVLPFLHLPRTRRLPASALIIGSTAPDLIYLFGMRGAASHLPWGLLRFCLPAGVLAFLYLEGLLLPALGPAVSSLLPSSWQPISAALLRPRPLPKHLGEWLGVGIAVVLGAATHLLWDGFTHAWMWPANVMYPGITIMLVGHAVLVSKLLQHLSSLLGLIVVLLYLRLTMRRASENSPSLMVRTDASRRCLRLFFLPLCAAVLAAIIRTRHPHPLFERALWDAAWAATAAFAGVLGIVCWIDGVGRR